MKILVLNCGSSSLKYQLIDMEHEQVIAKGNYEKIGSKDSFLTHKVNDEKYVIESFVENHDEAIKLVVEQLLNKEYAVIKSLDEINGIGHRVVHGGEIFDGPALINEKVIEQIEECAVLAPLHNPAAVLGMKACIKMFPNVKMAAVFDTAFHQTMKKEQYIYPIPYEYYEKYGVRKYGAHGTSHEFVSKRVAEILGRNVEDLKIVSCHIGQGASICAIKNGKSVDITMGLTPLGGIAMGSRSGDLDPSVVTYIMKKENISPDEMNIILNKKSGLLGISGISDDNRDILIEIEKGNERAKLAFNIYTYIIAQYIAKYAVTMKGVDVITFAGGVGERGIDEREAICDYLEFMGVKIDRQANNVKAVEKEISTFDSKVKVWIVPTDEELMIARDTKMLIK